MLTYNQMDKQLFENKNNNPKAYAALLANYSSEHLNNAIKAAGLIDSNEAKNNLQGEILQEIQKSDMDKDRVDHLVETLDSLKKLGNTSYILIFDKQDALNTLTPYDVAGYDELTDIIESIENYRVFNSYSLDI